MDEVTADDGPDPNPNPVPFVIAFVAVAAVAVLGFLFLRDDDPGRLVAPDGITVVGDDIVRLSYDGPFEAHTAEVVQVGYALGDDEILVELVIDEHDCDDTADCGPPTESLTVDLQLPEPVEGRDVRAGTGRALADCDRDPEVPTCR